MIDRHQGAVDQSSRTRHEGNAVAHMREAATRLATAISDAEQGNYKDAMATARVARDGLYFAEYELRKAETASLRGS